MEQSRPSGQDVGSTAPQPYAIVPTIGEPGADEMRLVEHLIHEHATRCDHCQRLEVWSEVFDVYLFRNSRRLQPCTRLVPGTPIGISVLKGKTIPVCRECFGKVSEANTPGQLAALHGNAVEWSHTMARKAKEAEDERRASRAARAKVPFTIPDADSF